MDEDHAQQSSEARFEGGVTRTLVTIAFAVDWPEEDLHKLAAKIDEGMRQGIVAGLQSEGATIEDVSDLIDFYGAVVSPAQPLEAVA